tara:strand:+ start:26526 stop:26945 length:420 start_codon:yes stop_codon:yes gene_type:complete
MHDERREPAPETYPATASIQTTERDMGIETKWRCGECHELHSDEDEAHECCQPSVTEVYVCPACQDYHFDEADAELCCGVSQERCPVCCRDHGASSIDAVAIRVAGHCRTCKPHFSIDQQFTIESNFEQISGQFVSLNR